MISDAMNHATSNTLLPNLRLAKTLWDALRSEQVTLPGLRAVVPGTLPIRLSVVMGNVRMQRILRTLLRPGDCVVDVGANIGYNTIYAAQCVGPRGTVYAVEPAQDNLSILYINLFLNNLQNVIVLPYAAGSTHAILQFFLRGDVSAVNSLYQDNFYHPITQTVEVLAAPLDDLVTHTPTLVKIDVEGGELAVLAGMTRLLRDPALKLVIEWHPALQMGAGYVPDELPRYLRTLGYTVHVVTHTHTTRLDFTTLSKLTARLLATRSPVELLALH
jgi:FkbM family methyltransferase